MVQQAVTELVCDRCLTTTADDDRTGWSFIQLSVSGLQEAGKELCPHCTAAIRFCLVTPAVMVVVTHPGDLPAELREPQPDPSKRCATCGRLPGMPSAPCPQCSDRDLRLHG